MMKELGELFGWILVIALVGTILNFWLKIVNRRFSKKISDSPNAKKTIKVLMIIFVKNHRYFGFATVVLLLSHFFIQLTNIGLNVTGSIAAVILIVQVLLGIYAYVKKRPRKGLWFIVHRVLAILIILGIALHLIAPYALNKRSEYEPTKTVTDSPDTAELPTFTQDELSKYNGEDGSKAYIAYKGMVYEVTDVPAWDNGEHKGNSAGVDVTEKFKEAPHGTSVLSKLKVVGKMQ